MGHDLGLQNSALLDYVSFVSSITMHVHLCPPGQFQKSEIECLSNRPELLPPPHRDFGRDVT